MSSRHLLVFLTSLAILALAACAQQSSPTGGIKDEIEPIVLKATPPDNTVNFSASEISLTFDEYVQLNDVFNQLIVSPPLQKVPVVSLKKKTVTVKFEEELRPNTTYTLNFGEGIKDNNEGNIATGLSYVFSTGPFLDSLAIRFKVVDAMSDAPLEKVKVMLYDQLEDSLPLTTRPTYLGISDETGYVKIENLAANRYKVFALKETNATYLFDSEDEQIGYTDSTFVLPGHPDSVITAIRLYTERQSIQYLDGTRLDSTGFAAIRFKTFPDSLQVVNLEPENYALSYHFENAVDSLFIWLTANEGLEVEDKKYGNKPEIAISDGVFADTISLLYFDDLERNLSLKTNFKENIAPEDTLRLNLQDGMKLVDKSAVSLLEDSIPLDFALVPLRDIGSSYQLKASFKDGKKYDFEVLPSAFQNRSGFAIDTLVQSFSTHEPKHYASLRLSIPLEKFGPDAVLQMLDEGGKLMLSYTRFEEENGMAVFSFDRMVPKTIQFRILYDTNGDGSWTTGSYAEKRQPEILLALSEPVKLRSNWNLELEWEFKP